MEQVTPHISQATVPLHCEQKQPVLSSIIPVWDFICRDLFLLNLTENAKILPRQIGLSASGLF